MHTSLQRCPLNLVEQLGQIDVTFSWRIEGARLGGATSVVCAGIRAVVSEAKFMVGNPVTSIPVSCCSTDCGAKKYQVGGGTGETGKHNPKMCDSGYAIQDAGNSKTRTHLTTGSGQRRLRGSSVRYEARYPSGKGEVCKTFIRRFDSDPRLQCRGVTTRRIKSRSRRLWRWGASGQSDLRSSFAAPVRRGRWHRLLATRLLTF